MEPSVCLGQALRTARERCGLSREQLAAQTGIPLADVVALEAGDLNALPAGLYGRAEVRAYADAVGLDPEQTLAALRHALDPAGTRPTREVAATTAAAASRAADVPASCAVHAAGVRIPPDRLPDRPRSALTRSARVLAVAAAGALALMSDRVTAPPEPIAGHLTGPLADLGPLFGAEATGDADLLPPVVSSRSTEPADVRRSQHGLNRPDVLHPATSKTPTAPPSRPTLRVPLASKEGRRSYTATDEGVLVVHSTPRGARVTVNGVGRGETPATIRYLPFGRQRLRLVKDGFHSVARVVQLSHDAPVRTVRLTMRPAERREAAQTGKHDGVLVVTTTPEGARVTVNGIGWGPTPATIRRLAPGPQHIRVVLAGYVSEERVVQLDEGNTRHVTIALRPHGDEISPRHPGA